MIANLLAGWQYRRFLSACDAPLAAQAARLRRILQRASATEIGKRSGFAELARIADPAGLIARYQDRVPLRRYQEMKSELDRVYAGDWRTLCPSRPVFFSMTTGSTGRFKYIPVTAEYRRELGRASLIFLGALLGNCPGLGRLKTQFLVGSAEGGVSPAGIPQGFASGFNYRNLPRLIRDRFVLPYWIFTLESADDRAYAAGRILAGHPRLGAVCAISPVNLVNLREALERHAERLFQDLETGALTVGSRAAVPGSWRGHPNPRLAALLRAGRLRDGRLPDRLLFPALQVLVCWQGGNMGYYLRELDASFGITRHFELPISASEGIFAIACQANRAGGILAITSHFLEFVPDAAPLAGGEASRPLRADQLQAGASYRLVVTNSGGLYRYDMEDIVRVTGFQRRTPVIEFVSKQSRQVSLANERLTELDVTAAMEATSRAARIWFPEFLFVPCSDRRYRVLVDGAAAGSAGDLCRFALELERQLRRTAKGYDFEREDALLAPLELIVTAPGVLRRHLRERQGAPALPSAQLKPQHLTSELDAHERLGLEQIHAM